MKAKLFALCEAAIGILLCAGVWTLYATLAVVYVVCLAVAALFYLPFAIGKLVFEKPYEKTAGHADN